jgi:Flp pilus assembly protein TadB
MQKRIIFSAVLVVFTAASVFFGITYYSSETKQVKAAAEKTEKTEKAESKKAEEKKKEEEKEAKKLEKEKKEKEKKEEKEKLAKEKEKKPRKGPMAELFLLDSELENGVQKSLTEKSKQVLTVWAALKVVNGVINVLQSVQIGGSAVVEFSINPMEFLAPVDKILDKISDLLLWAFGALVFEKILLAISWYLVFVIIIPICVIISLVTIWTQKDKTKLLRIVIVTVFISLIVSFIIPISLQVSAIIEKKILSNNVEKVLKSIEDKSKTAEGMEKELTRTRRMSTSVTNNLTNTKNLSSALIEDSINFFIIFIFTGVIIPILTFLGIIYLSKYVVKLILAR